MSTRASLLWSRDTKSGDLIAYDPKQVETNPDGTLTAQGRIREQDDGSYKVVVRCVDGVRQRIDETVWHCQNWADVAWGKGR